MWKDIFVWIFLLFHTITDLKSRKINIVVCLIFASVGLILFAFGSEKDWLSMFGGILTGCYLLFFSFITKEAVGFGDGCVVMALGIWLGGGKTLLILMGGFVLTALFGVVRVCMKKATGKSELAFIPFFTLSYSTFYIGGLL